MATTKRSKITINVGNKGKTKPKKKKQVLKVSIPTRASKPPTEFCKISVFLHGEKKIGKTSLLGQEPGAFFLEFDPEQPFAILQRHVPDWKHFIAYIDLLENDPPENVQTAIIDGVDIAYKMCFDYCCQKMVINHPHEENDYGMSWNTIRNEFEQAILRLLNLEDISARFISHSKWQEVDSHSGDKINRLMPYLTSQADEILSGRCDLWAAYLYDGKRHILAVKGDESIACGHRIDGQFRTPDGEQIEEIDLGNSPQEAYENLISAFNNEQEYITVDELDPKPKSKLKMKGKTAKKKKASKKKR